DVSRLLDRQRRLLEARSATQPLGSTAPLEPARLSSRLKATNEGFGRMAEGAEQLRKGLTEGAAKLQTAVLVEEMTGTPLTGNPPPTETSTRDALVSGLMQASGALFGATPSPSEVEVAPSPSSAESSPTRVDSPQEKMLR